MTPECMALAGAFAILLVTKLTLLLADRSRGRQHAAFQSGAAD